MITCRVCVCIHTVQCGVFHTKAHGPTYEDLLAASCYPESMRAEIREYPVRG